MDSIAMSELKSELSQFNGTEQYWKGDFTLNYTDGIKALWEKAGCYWLVTDISILVKSRFRDIPFQSSTLRVHQSKDAVLTMQEDTGKPYLYKKKYEWVDFPVGEFNIWVIDQVMILPSEY